MDDESMEDKCNRCHREITLYVLKNNRPQSPIHYHEDYDYKPMIGDKYILPFHDNVKIYKDYFLFDDNEYYLIIKYKFKDGIFYEKLCFNCSHELRKNNDLLIDGCISRYIPDGKYLDDVYTNESGKVIYPDVIEINKIYPDMYCRCTTRLLEETLDETERKITELMKRKITELMKRKDMLSEELNSREPVKSAAKN